MARSRRAVFVCCDGLGRDWVQSATPLAQEDASLAHLELDGGANREAELRPDLGGQGDLPFRRDNALHAAMVGNLPPYVNNPTPLP